MNRTGIWKVLLGIAVLIGGTIGITLACSASSPSPVYTCADYGNCANGQFLEVFDHLGSPIFSVGETGGSKVFGDCSSDYAPSSIYDPVVTMCYHAPSGACKSPQSWLAPDGLYLCQNSSWRKMWG